MSVRILVWYLALSAAAFFAIRRGGGPERAAAVLMVVASIATTIAPSMSASLRPIAWPLASIDLLLLLCLVAVALIADRFWPLYLAAIQLMAVSVHGVRAYDPTILPAVYFRVVGELAYPMLLILIFGTRRNVLRGGGTDWSWQIGHDRFDRGDHRQS